MYLKKLELVGFKSFYNKTTLHFDPGITAIVGPNGCGKSNIFDSIRWVLGEQSVKALRGSNMQDVIFNGTDAKEPLGMAEVTLAFDNTNNFFNIANDEVSITRRIFRSGESEYLLNKTQVRLKDIMDLLMGTGIGAESYSLVEQGKIDLVLSSKPEDRRLVFDEAAGITRYKTQKKETLRKLEETEQNLLRVNDIITEVKRQIGSLERQANKARRYKEVFEELKAREVNLAISQKSALLKQKNEISSQINSRLAEENKLSRQIEEQESKINNSQTELNNLEEQIMAIKNEVLSLDSSVFADKERINFSNRRITELESSSTHLARQIEQTKNKILLDEERLNNLKEENNGINKNIEEKTSILKEREGEFAALTSSIKNSLNTIAVAKKEILNLVSRIANTRNEIADSSAKEQIHLARKKRLELEKIKIREEKTTVENESKDIVTQLQDLNKIIQDSNTRVSGVKEQLRQEESILNSINEKTERLEKVKLTLESQREFIERLKTKYEGIGESMNAVVYLDKLPSEKMSGLVIKIKELEEAGLKLSGEAKPIDLDTQKINEKIEKIQQELGSLKADKAVRENLISDLNLSIQSLQEELRSHDIAVANKKTAHQTVTQQLNKLQEEEDILVLELNDVEEEIAGLGKILLNLKSNSNELETKNRQIEETIAHEQDTVASNSDTKEKVMVAIASTKTELDALNKRIKTDEATLNVLEETCRHDEENLENLLTQVEDIKFKRESTLLEIKELNNKIEESNKNIEYQKSCLKDTQDRYQKLKEGSSELLKSIESCRKELDSLKNITHELQMQDKDVDFKILSIKERLLQAYKIDLDTLENTGHEIDEGALSEEIQKLKEKLDSYGTVNLVAIEEYEELKKRYDFLTRQQNDLVAAKDSLHEAIQKINRTTKKMFLETFEKVRLEFRNYFRLLFNGGDAQIFLIDEQDPLESGIEIICRPPGKKLQNVLLLSGGERALSAIALIFAIFKIKPAPFCVLDEIDAALDEANVDRYSRILKEFINESQFIVITHNKRTIVNADVMYGITMQESGISKIVSVKFAQSKPLKDKEPDATVAEPV